jgi:hypothetical protein
MEVYDSTKMEIYAFSDLAAGEEAVVKRKTAARQTIMVCARDAYSRWFVIHEWAGRVGTSKFRDLILDAYAKYKPYRYGIEANGMQVLFGAIVRDAGIQRFGKRARFLPIYQPRGVKKEYRIRTALEPVISEGRLFILDKTGELAQEIRGFPTAKTKDLVDSLATIVGMAPKTTKQRGFDRELKEYAKYLRSTGCPAHLIKEKVTNYRQRLKFEQN